MKKLTIANMAGFHLVTAMTKILQISHCQKNPSKYIYLLICSELCKRHDRVVPG
jgi:hypothetical protein